jgi:hypothetical protein
MRTWFIRTLSGGCCYFRDVPPLATGAGELVDLMLLALALLLLETALVPLPLHGTSDSREDDEGGDPR